MKLNLDLKTNTVCVPVSELAFFARTRTKPGKGTTDFSPSTIDFDEPEEAGRKLSVQVQTGALRFTVTGYADMVYWDGLDHRENEGNGQGNKPNGAIFRRDFSCGLLLLRIYAL